MAEPVFYLGVTGGTTAGSNVEAGSSTPGCRGMGGGGAKPWMLQALHQGILLWKKCHFLLAWAWFGFAVSCLANYSLVKEWRPFTTLPSTQNEVITDRKRLSFWRNFLIPHTPPSAKHPCSPLPWAGIRAIPNSLGNKYFIAISTCRFP